ncbi:hypothetical protein NE237_030272 [Protea cynaroides]|uniref:Uncharacterized protein n=1 Tax=Protea cynaroides TaxID=273540 RepID=A0A9Q0GVV3_9MAGN|nr:hypothetical protein NE237_030272 [Protea cynaroides]
MPRWYYCSDNNRTSFDFKSNDFLIDTVLSFRYRFRNNTRVPSEIGGLGGHSHFIRKERSLCIWGNISFQWHHGSSNITADALAIKAAIPDDVCVGGHICECECGHLYVWQVINQYMGGFVL